LNLIPFAGALNMGIIIVTTVVFYYGYYDAQEISVDKKTVGECNSYPNLIG
jgi:hypothetical protein